MAQEQIDLVKKGYDAFGRGDVEGLIALLDTNVEWTTPGPKDLPTAGTRRGQDAVREFFGLMDQHYVVELFEPKSFISDGDTVVVQGVDTIKVKATGKSLSETWAHVFTVKGGSIVAFKEYLDTAAVVTEHRMATANA
jgi:ketosteroid isomerase-like protein